jgi:hypothetical protein
MMLMLMLEGVNQPGTFIINLNYATSRRAFSWSNAGNSTTRPLMRPQMLIQIITSRKPLAAL